MGEPHPGTPAQRASPWQRLIPPLALFLIVSAVYLPSTRNGFVYDDEVLITDETRPTRPAQVLRAFTERHWPNLPYYRPVTRVTFLLQKYLHDDDPGPYHLFNILLMGLAAVAAYVLLRSPVLRIRRAVAALAALVFGVHPVASMTVYPICSGRETLLPAALMLLSTTAWLGRGRGTRGCAWVLFTLALFAKEQAVVLPALFVVADVAGLTDAPPENRPARWLARYWPIFLILAVYLPIRFALFGGTELATDLARYPWRPFLSYLYALQILVLPFTETVYEPTLSVWLSAWRLGVALAAVGCLAVAVVVNRPGLSRFTLFWGAWFFVLQLPTANLLRQEAKFAERYVFLAGLGIVAITAHLVSQHWDRVVVRRATVVFVCLAAIVLAALSMGRRAAFVDDYAFSAQWAKTDPHAPIALNNLGNEFIKRGRLEEAEQMLRRSIAVHPVHADAHFNLGLALYKQGRLPGSIGEYRIALEQDPACFADYNLGLALADVGDTQGARDAYEAALVKKPNHADSHYNLALLLARGGDPAAALQHLLEASRLRTDDVETVYNLGVTYEALGRNGDAMAAYEQTVALKSGHTNAHYNLANLLLREADNDGAIRHYREVLRLDPADQQARWNLEAALELKRKGASLPQGKGATPE